MEIMYFGIGIGAAFLGFFGGIGVLCYFFSLGIAAENKSGK